MNYTWKDKLADKIATLLAVLILFLFLAPLVFLYGYAFLGRVFQDTEIVSPWAENPIITWNHVLFVFVFLVWCIYTKLIRRNPPRV